ncbi:hypothetical protein [Micromonospora sp. ATA51]|uniref:hypothetical protein n=1 Tax=Micromonospora sp. ATA51 TaxID=2806098 RepID=UPI001A5F9293|nr:hypothetical protein [Micromonospora sp. ATA51]MBM0228231.1 hypothetical protein [Micromonospora sp. ATA51]
MGRGALQVHVDVGSGLRLITCHLKSKLLTYPDNRRYPKNEDERARGAGYALLRRAAEAVAVRVRLNKVMTASATGGEPGMPTIVCGDLNDGPDAVTTTLLAGPDDGDIDRPDKGDPVRLYNLAPLLPPGRPTHASIKDEANSSVTSSSPATYGYASPASTASSTTSARSPHPPKPDAPPPSPTTPPSSPDSKPPTPAENGTIDHQTALSLGQCRLGRSTER